MILKNIYLCLINLGFRSIGINKDNISLFQHVDHEKVNVVAIYDCPSGLEYSPQQIVNINSQINSFYYDKGYSNINLLGIISTKNVENIRKIIETNNNFWIIDTYEKKLIIYENQDGDLLGLRKKIEDILLKDQINDTKEGQIELSQTYPNYVSTRTAKSIIGQYVSKWNTILIITNILIYLILDYISIRSNNDQLTLSGALYWPAIYYSGEYYRLLTYMFLHSSIEHLANNMLVLFFLGDNLERAAGKWKFLIMYFGSGFIAGVVSMSYNMYNDFNVISIGASGAIFGVVGAMVFIVLKNKGRLENISARQMILFVLFSLYGGLTSQGVDNAAHIGGLIAGFILAAILYKNPKKRTRRGGYQ